MHQYLDILRKAEKTGARAAVAAILWQWRWFALFVLAPTLLATLYFGVIAADVFVSESRFVIKTPERKQGGGSPLGSLLQGTGLGGGAEQSNEIIDYMRSRDALADLSKQVDVRGAFGSEEADFLSRFPLIYQSDSFEDLFAYYKSMVTTQPDPETGLAVLKVNAYTPEEAQAINRGLLNLGEALVNRLNSRANLQAINEADERVVEAQDRLREARIQLGAYRNSSELLDPQQQGIGVLAISETMIAQEAALRAQLTEVQRNAPNHPSIPALQDRISGISRQIAEQTGRAVGTPDGIAAKITQYENLLIEKEFAEQALAAAMGSLEQARVEAKQKQYYLERVVEPNRPDVATLPARLRGVLAVLFGTLCLYLVGWMLAVGVREHASED